MSDHPSESRCKHDRRIFDACSECENEAELALQDDQKNYVLKLKAETARLTAELVRVEKELEYNAAEMSKSWDYYARFKESRDKELTAALTRAKSAEDRCERLAAVARMADLLEKAAAKMIFHESGDTHIRISDDDVSERADLVRRWSTYRESFGNLYDTCDANHDLTPHGDAGKGGG